MTKESLTSEIDQLESKVTSLAAQVHVAREEQARATLVATLRKDLFGLGARKAQLDRLNGVVNDERYHLSTLKKLLDNPSYPSGVIGSQPLVLQTGVAYAQGYNLFVPLPPIPDSQSMVPLPTSLPLQNPALQAAANASDVSSASAPLPLPLPTSLPLQNPALQAAANASDVSSASAPLPLPLPTSLPLQNPALQAAANVSEVSSALLLPMQPSAQGNSSVPVLASSLQDSNHSAIAQVPEISPEGVLLAPTLPGSSAEQ